MTPRALTPIAALRGSWALFRQRPLGALCVATALLTSLLAVCCGLGIVAAPWFMCELTALQIGCGLDISARRKLSWFAAGIVYLAVALVLATIAALTVFALGADVALGAAHVTLPLSASLFACVAVLLSACAFALALVVHFAYAPAILIERGGGLVAALLESARLVSASGFGRTWLVGVVAYSLLLLPAAATVMLTMSRGTLAGTIWWGLAMLPVNALGVSLGQGMVVASYLALQDALLTPAQLHVRAPASGGPVWVLLLALVMVGPMTVLASLAKPAGLEAGALPDATEPLLTLAVRDDVQEVYLPDTALRLVVDAKRVRVIASDGGGAGRLPLPSGRIGQVRAARTRVPGTHEAAFTIEVQLAAGPRYVTSIDEAGVRLDDGLTRRFAQRMPGVTGLGLLACLVGTSTWLCRALPPQARARRHWLKVRTDATARAFRRLTWRAALWLAPAALGSIGIGLWAALHG